MKIWQYRELIKNFTVAASMNCYQNTMLGFFWSILKPFIKQYYKNDPWVLNYFKNNLEYSKGLTTLSSYPNDIAFAISAACNADCIFCLTKPFRQKYRDRYFDLSDWEKFKTILKYAHAVGIPGPGEPLLHPQFEELINKLSHFIDERCNVYLITNGLLISKYYDFLIKSRINTFDVSLNASSPDTHRKVLGLKVNYFNEIIDYIKLLVNIRDAKQKNIRINITFVVINQNLHEIADFITLGNALRVDGIYIRPFVIESSNIISKPSVANLQPISHPKFNELVNSAIAAISRSNVPVYAKPWLWGKEKINTLPHRCNLVYSKLFLHNEFYKIWPCCVIGDLDDIHPIDYDGTIDFFEVWNSPTMVNLRKSLLNGPLNKVCKTCQIG